MKRFLHLLILLVLSASFCGCPYDSPYPIDQEPQQPIDDSLVGKWATYVAKPTDDWRYKEEPVKIIIDKKTDTLYDIAITGYINELKRYRMVVNDSIKGTAFLSTVSGKQFLNVYIYSKVYIAEVIKEGKTLSILPLAEHFTSKYIKNSKQLTTAIQFHYRTRATPMYDDYCILKNLQKVN